MSTPRTDLEFAKASREAVYVEDIVTGLLTHARALEAELARCRLALAWEYDLSAEWRAALSEPEKARECRELAATLRDLTQPTPEVLP